MTQIGTESHHGGDFGVPFGLGCLQNRNIEILRTRLGHVQLQSLDMWVGSLFFVLPEISRILGL